MKKVFKYIGVGSVVVTVAGAIAFILKKVKDVDDYKLPSDYEPADDMIYHGDDTFEDETDDFPFESETDDVFSTGLTDEAFKKLTGVDKIEALTYIASKLAVDDEKVGFIIPDTVLADMYNVCKRDAKSEESNLDLFKMLCGVTREEAIEELIAYDSSMYNVEELSKLEDKELCQFYADYKVEKDKSASKTEEEDTLEVIETNEK